MRCSNCQQWVGAIHDVTRRHVRDLPILGSRTLLWLERVRVACPRCGPRVEHLDWLVPHARVTQRLAHEVVRLCRFMSIRHVAQYFGLGWDSVKGLEKDWLSEQFATVDLQGVETILMDEFALQKRHRYATVIADPRTKRVLWVGRGRGRVAIRPFFELLGPQGCRRLKAVGMDMNGAYEAEVRAHCPHAAIVYDKFHLIAKYAREVIDRVRSKEARRLRQDPKQYRVIKKSRYLLLANRPKSLADGIRLEELLEANKALSTVFLLRADLRRFWSHSRPKAAYRFWSGWARRARKSKIPDLIRFVDRLEPYMHGVLAHCHWPLNTGLLEGINNKIKVIKRMAYGFRDHDYFFLKIRAAFPGVPG